jgi:hypothetical protein
MDRSRFVGRSVSIHNRPWVRGTIAERFDTSVDFKPQWFFSPGLKDTLKCNILHTWHPAVALVILHSCLPWDSGRRAIRVEWWYFGLLYPYAPLNADSYIHPVDESNAF